MILMEGLLLQHINSLSSYQKINTMSIFTVIKNFQIILLLKKYSFLFYHILNFYLISLSPGFYFFLLHLGIDKREAYAYSTQGLLLE